MRAIVILLAALLTLPLLGASALAPSQALPVARALPVGTIGDIPDGDLLILLAMHEGIPATHPTLVVPAGASVPGLVLELGLRAGLDVTPSDAALFATLDPRVAGPVTTLLVAMNQAWDLRDQAFAKLTPEQLLLLHNSAQAHDFNDPAAVNAVQLVNTTALVNAAILLLDTTEGVVIPALQAAVAAGAWPPTAIADPVGVLRLGSPGNDVESVDRLVQIDPSGDDIYNNNAGGGTLYTAPIHAGSPLAMSIDFAGNDVYTKTKLVPAQGGSDEGVGILLDLKGNDSYTCYRECLGSALTGVSLARDFSGSDSYWAGDEAQGYSSNGVLGVLRDDSGDDSYYAGAAATGAADQPGSMGLLWERAGTDSYSTRGSYAVMGFSEGAGDGWLVDEGPEIDSHIDHEGEYTVAHTCNDCVWRFGAAPSSIDGRIHGIGVDNSGGLARLIEEAYTTP